MTGSRDVFVVQPGRLRVVLAGMGLVLCAAVMLLIAAGAVLFAGTIDSIAARAVLVVVALGTAAVAVFLLLYLQTLALRIELGPQRLKLRMPRMRGHLPMLGLIRADIPYDVVASVQGRIELYGGLGRMWVQRAFSLVTRDGERLPLGYVIEDEAFQYPFEQAAAMIAERAACPAIWRDPVRVGSVLRAMIRGAPDWSASR
jgi:hypothetical protein